MPKLKLTYFDFHGGRGEPAETRPVDGRDPVRRRSRAPSDWRGASRTRRSALYRCSKSMGRHSHNRMPSIVMLASLRISTHQTHGRLHSATR